MVAFMADKQKSLPRPSGTGKKSTSTPKPRHVTDVETGDMSAADKKRNKLGYHRTAVACGHCRRRKIRCIPALDTTSTRCQNCIRLKKDCQFYPVDQNMPAQPRRYQSEPKVDALATGSETSVSSSSPKISTSVSIVDQYEHFRTPTETVAISQGPEHDYPHTYDHRPWYPSEASQHTPWLQHDQNHPDSFTPSLYPITPTTTGSHSVNPHEHAYTYPAIALDHRSYPYPGQGLRNGPFSPQNGHHTPFVGLRSNTMPERIEIPGQSLRSHDVHQPSASVPSQQLMGPLSQPISTSSSQYSPATPYQVWSPSNSEGQHHPTEYLQQSHPPSWYNQAAGFHGVRESNGTHLRPRESASGTPNRYLHNPG